MQEIAEGIVVSTEFRRITVGAFATGKGLVCIDVPPVPADARRWRSQLLEYFKQPIRLVVLTDAQRDRLAGLHWFDEAHVIAHDATMQAMRTLPSNFVDLTADLLARDSNERLSFVGVRLCYPRVTFNDRLTVYVENVGLELIAMPGPTPGNVWVQFLDEGIVFVGDSVVVDEPPYMARAQSKAWLDSLTMLRRPRFGAEVIVPGRGPLTDRESTTMLSEFLRYVRRRVMHFHRSGRQRVEVLDLLPDVMDRVPHISLGEREDVERRVKSGLESIYDEFVLEAEMQAQTEMALAEAEEELPVDEN